jgi:cell division transport system ATP-binding protein
MIQLYHVHKSFSPESHALVDLTLHIPKGEFVFLTGPSGAGKSTLLRMIFSADDLTSGQLLVNGRNIARLKRSAIPFLRRNIGVVFQDFKLLANRTVEENVAIALKVLGMPGRQVRQKAFAMLKHVGLVHKRHQYPPTLSGGEQQRVAIARALVNDPQILLADEPTGNLDADRAAEIFSLIEDVNTRGTTVVLATHDQHLPQQHRYRVLRLEQGRLTADRKPL